MIKRKIKSENEGKFRNAYNKNTREIWYFSLSLYNSGENHTHTQITVSVFFVGFYVYFQNFTG